MISEHCPVQQLVAARLPQFRVCEAPRHAPSGRHLKVIVEPQRPGR
jgi:hypothetical protein